jgi:hypothetical protein
MYRTAKQNEVVAREQRIHLENEIADHVGFNLETGSQTYTTQTDEGSAKLVVKKPRTRDVDQDAIPKIKKILKGARFGKVFRNKWSVIAAGLKALMERDHDLYIEIAEHITEKPGKIAVELKELQLTGNEGS